ncbi:MAG: hypothetical protein GX458_18765 [Phyllobacteriaceae bacterium]|nr:hypothetical protein [Phyllobacteriaceae bacterium]
MRLFRCDACDNTVHFDNTVCVACARRLGWFPDAFAMTALEPVGDHLRSPHLGRDFVYCANAAHDACNWLLPIERAGELCPACRHNRTIPALDVADNLAAFRRITRDERHLFYSLLRWGLDAPTKSEDPVAGLAFDFLADAVAADGTLVPVTTGHADGVITLAISEADDAERERRRTDLGEPYRTLLGHFRHEIGHYFWDRLVRDGGRLDAFRAVFGDERADYGAALARHYDLGPPPNWSQNFVSAYASAHPWEDFAETWAHHMHMVDALETARAFGLELAPHGAAGETLALEVDFDPYRVADFGRLATAWPPLTVALNAINRSLGQRDVYPFVSTPTIEAKLAFVHGLLPSV